MSAGVEGYVFLSTEKFPVDTLYNPVTQGVGRHMEELSPGSVKQPHYSERFSGKHLLNRNKNLLSCFSHTKEKPTLISDPPDV